MALNGKRKGTRNEHRSIALLEASGYRCTRSGGSLGAWDIIGISATGILLLQVKTRDWPGKAELETLAEFPAPFNVVKLVHRWRDREKFPDVKEIL